MRCSSTAPRAASLIASPAARSSSQSGNSPTTAPRFARIADVAFPRFRRSCEFWSAARAAFGKLTTRAPRRGEGCERRRADARVLRLCASGRSCPPRRRPPRVCPAPSGPCRQGSPTTPLHSSRRTSGGTHPVGEVRADILHLQHVDEELAELVDPGGLVLSNVLTQHSRTRGGRCDDCLR